MKWNLRSVVRLEDGEVSERLIGDRTERRSGVPHSFLCLPHTRNTNAKWVFFLNLTLFFIFPLSFASGCCQKLAI